MEHRGEFYRNERRKWDEISLQKLDASQRQQLVLSDDDDFLSVVEGSSTTPGVAEFLGELVGKQALEIGCGSGKNSALLAKSGANVFAFDLSPISVAVTNLRATLNNVADDIHAVVAAGEQLPYPDDHFDIIFGRAILHHLDVSIASTEIHRVLKPGGKAVFVEPMGMNPILNFVRDHVPYPDKNPVGDDKPLNYDEIRGWGAPYSQFRYREVHLLGMIQRAFGYKHRVRLDFLHRLDDAILKTLPFMGRFYRYVVLYMQK